MSSAGSDSSTSSSSSRTEFLSHLMQDGTSLTTYECLKTMAGTFFLFVLLNMMASVYLKVFFKQLRDHWNFWRFKNTSLSWCHSIFASILVFINIYNRPELMQDMQFVRTKFACFTICVSIAYFMYDAFDILYSNKKLKTQSYEVLLHHFIIVITFSITIVYDMFLGYTIAALAIEFNTVFLHLRFLLTFLEFDRKKQPLLAIKILNIVTFVLFRLLILSWMLIWVYLNYKTISTAFVIIGVTGLIVMMTINIILLQRLIKADFIDDADGNGSDGAKAKRLSQSEKNGKSSTSVVANGDESRPRAISRSTPHSVDNAKIE